MNTIIWFALALVLGQFILGVLVDQSLPRVRDPEFAIKLKRYEELLHEYPDRPSIMMLGSSRTAFGFRGKLIGAASDNQKPIIFNFAYPGGGPFLQRITLQRLKEANRLPSVLLVEIMPIFFNGPAGEKMELKMLDTARLSAQELGLLSDYSGNFFARSHRWMFARSIPIWKHRSELRDCIGLDEFLAESRPPEVYDFIEADGWTPQDSIFLSRNRLDLAQLAHRQYDRFYDDYLPSTAPLQQLRELLKDALAEKITPILVLMPEGSEFRHLATAKHEEGFQRMLHSLQEEFSISLIDGREWVADEEFFDGHHVFDKGAESLTYKLGEELRKRIIDNR